MSTTTEQATRTPIQKPTVGGQVWYWPTHWEHVDASNACTATVASTADSRSLSHPCTALMLQVILPDGRATTARGVYYSPVPKAGCWMWPVITREEVDPALYQDPLYPDPGA